MNELVAVGIFFLTLIALFTEKRHRVVISGLGASAMLTAGRLLHFYEEQQAIAAVEFETLGLLLGMMMLVALLQKTGFFEYIAIQVAQHSGGSAVRLLLTLGITTSLLSMVLDNVTTVVLMAPMTVLVAEYLNISPIPLLISQAIFSNTSGMATLVGDPPNIIIGSAGNLTFMDFLIHMGPIVLMVWIAVYFTLRYLFRGLLKTPADKQQHANRLEKLKPDEALTDRTGAKRILIILGGVVVLFILESVLQFTPAFAALTGAAVALAWTQRNVRDVLEAVEWDVLLFFTGLFVMVGGLEAAGVLQSIAEIIAEMQNISPVVFGLILIWGMAILSAVVDNVPITIAAIPIVLSLEARGINVRPIWWAIALGAGLGGNATPIGSTANVVVMSVSERTGRPINTRQWLTYGIPTTLIGTVAASIMYVLLFNFLSGG